MKTVSMSGDYDKPILVKDLGMHYATNKSKKRIKFGLYLCPCCKNRYVSSMNNILTGKSTKCRKCGYLSASMKNRKYDKARMDIASGINNKQSCMVYQIDNDGNLIDTYYSYHYASLMTGISISSIHMACNGKRKTAGGYFWKAEERGERR